MKTDIKVPLMLLASGMIAEGAVTSAVISATPANLKEGETLVITLTAVSSYSGGFAGFIGISANVEWSNTDLFWPPASISWTGTGQQFVTESTASYPTYDDGNITVGCSGVAWEQFYDSNMQAYVSTPLPDNFTTATIQITIENVAPTITTSPADILINLGGGGSTTAFSAWAEDPGFHDVLTYTWDLDGDGFYDDASGTSTGEVDFSGYSPGVYTAKVRVSDDDGGVDVEQFQITVVPEPSVTLMALVAAGIIGLRRQRGPVRQFNAHHSACHLD